MEIYYIVLFAACFTSSMALEAINEGLISSYGEKKEKLAKNICRGIIILSFIAVIIFTIISKNL